VVTQLKDINSGGVLHLLYTDLPVVLDTIIATYADNTAILATHKDHIEASERLQESLFYIQMWLKKWRIRVNGAKSVHVTFTTRRKTCPPVILNGLRTRGIRSQIKLEKAHIHQAETTWNSTEQDVLAARQQIAAVDRK